MVACLPGLLTRRCRGHRWRGSWAGRDSCASAAPLTAMIGSVCVYFVAPYAFSRAVDVPPALILLGLFVGGLVGGFFAALLTVPLLAVALVILRKLRPDLAPEAPAAEPQLREARNEPG